MMLGLCAALALANVGVTVVTPPDTDAKYNVPARHRLPPTPFAVRVTPRFELAGGGVRVSAVAFPSAVVSKHPENNLVVGEFFAPVGAVRAPAVLVLDILDGAGVVSRGQAVWLAAQGVPSLVLTMPYYGPRRPLTPKVRLISTDVPGSLENMRQAVLDGRRGLAWLATRSEVDPERLGVVGTSLGSFLGALIAAAEPRVESVCLILGGGGLVDSFATHPQAVGLFRTLDAVGFPRALLRAVVDPVDPLTYARQLAGKRLLLIGASRDDVVPPVAMKRLWEVTGKPPILWLDATHVGAAAYSFRFMRAVCEHVRAEKKPAASGNNSPRNVPTP